MPFKSIVVNTGEQSEIQHIMDGFFQERVCDLTKRGFDRNLFNIRSGGIYYDNQESDDRVTSLLYEDRIVAAVLETRTLGNRVRYDFFRNAVEDI